MQNNKLPGLLSDRQIRALCEVPVAEIEFRDLRASGVSDNIILPIFANELAAIKHPLDGRHDPHFLKLAKVFGGKEGSEHGPGIDGLKVYDKDWVEEQQANFKPMIEPFLPNQVKLNERNATDTEVLRIRAWSANGIGKDGVLARLKIDNPSIQSVRQDVLLGFQILEKTVSSGLSSYGYDVTCGREFKIFTNLNSTVVDPKNFDEKSFVDVVTTDEKPYIIIPPNSFALARTKEYFRIPRNVLTVCLGKSTYARCGIIVNVTPFEPEWEGYVTLEFSNTTPLPAKIYADEGCAQVLFFRGSEPCEVSYKDRGGKYQGQEGLPVVPKV